ncbi:MAG: non-canonical purine NTP diphosphatase [Bacteroidales bacterium]|nr:non-canonical purine NTP diphosphatase [Bacteroidales bacterium]
MNKKLVFATNNEHKLAEIRAVVPKGFIILGLKDIGCTEDIIESADTLQGNADLKSMHVYSNYGMDCFADDTGLEVDQLNGRPGVYSARYAGEDGNAEKNIDKLLEELRGIHHPVARFRTVISLVISGKIKHFEGIVTGQIIPERRGKDGFGYDPVFMPDNHSQTFAEMPLQLKNSISHRGKAMQKLIDFLSSLKD